MPSLYPTFEMPDLAVNTTVTPVYGTSVFFDFAIGDFVLEGRGDVIADDGHMAWGQWCVKTAMTPRFSYLIYDNQYGTEVDQALKRKTRPEVEAEIERTITETLLADPRTLVIKDFKFLWTKDTLWGDILQVGFTAVPVVGAPMELEVKLNA